MLRTILLLPVLLAVQAFAQPRMSAITLHDLHHLELLAKRYPDARKLVEVTHGQFPTALINGRCMVGFLAHVPTGGSIAEDEAILSGARIGNVRSFRVDVRQLERVFRLNGADRVELAGVVHPLLDRVVHDIGADSVQQGIDLPQGFTGRDVLIGIPDFGLEYAHPMFYDTALTATRIAAAWDQYKQSGPAPVGYGYGTAYLTPAEALAAAHDTLEDGIYDTHGTHVAGIAGGGGAGTPYRGIAFDAHYLFASMLHDFAGGLDAIGWMQQMAQLQQKRLVVNISWGSFVGASDGTSLLDEALDQLTEEGVVIVTSNGNDGGTSLHLMHTFAADTLRSRAHFYTFGNDPYVYGNRIMLWGDAGAAFAAALSLYSNGDALLAMGPWWNTAAQPIQQDTFLTAGADTLYLRITAEAAHPSNGRPYLLIDAKKTSGSQRVDLAVTATSGTVHAWNSAVNYDGLGFWGQAFQAALPGYVAGDDAYAVGEPTCARKVLSVGAYSARYQASGGNWVGGAGASFSSRGPSLDGWLKPEISAPGVNVGSPINSVTDEPFTPLTTVDFQSHTYPFARMSGTSMSAPAVTGVAALLLEAAPDATPAEIKQLIMDHARTDSFTGTIPLEGSNTWGMGKLDAYRTVVDVLGVAAVEERPADAVRLWPNPSTDELYVCWPGAGLVDYTVLDIAGRVLMNGRSATALFRIATEGWAAGAYGVRLSDGRRVITRQFIHQ